MPIREKEVTKMLKKSMKKTLSLFLGLLMAASVFGAAAPAALADDGAPFLAEIEISATVESAVEVDEEFYEELVADYETEQEFQVSTAGELAAISRAVNEGGLDFYGKTIIVMNSIDLGGSGLVIEKVPVDDETYCLSISGAVQNAWTPIGNSHENAFAGTFFGNDGGYEITNMVVPEGKAYAGLFGYVVEALISGVGIGEGSCVVGSSYSGAVAGDGFGSLISGCYNTGTVVSRSADAAYAGGITGRNDREMMLCYNSGDIYALSDNAELGASAGGIAGLGTNITSCYNTGSITASSAYRTSLAGGIAGVSRDGSIFNCYNTGDIFNYSSNSTAYTGGMAGQSSPVRSCYNTGNIASYSYGAGYSGGIAGFSISYDVINCYNTGNVEAFSTQEDSGSRAGGIVGASINSEVLSFYDSEITITGFNQGLGTEIVGLADAMSGSNYKTNHDDRKIFSGDNIEDTWLFAEEGTGIHPVFRPYEASEYPEVVKISPNPRSENVSVEGNIVITFDRPMSETVGTVRLAEIVLPPAEPPEESTALVNTAGAVWNEDGTVCTIPYSGLLYNTNYIILTNGFTGADGKPAIPDAEGFKTGVKPETPPLPPPTYGGSTTIGDTQTPLSPGASSITVGGQDIVCKTDEDGNITASPTEEQIKEILKASNGLITFDFSPIPDAKSICFEIDPAWFDGTGDDMLLKMGEHSLLISDGMLAELVNKFGGKVQFNVVRGSVSVHITQEGEEITWYSFEYPMTVTMPYTPAEGEDLDGIVMYENRSSEEPKRVVARSWYADGIVTAKVYVTGKFDAQNLGWGAFEDVRGKWMEEAVNYASARMIALGREQGIFDPDGTVTRAEFLTMLMRALDPEPIGAWMVQQFDDIPQDAYYYDAALKAKAFGIVNGTGDNEFNPDARISRQEMFAMLYNAMKVMHMLPEVMTTEFVMFEDGDEVAEFAATPIQTLAKLKLVSGFDGKIMPLGTATRAEAVQLIYNMLQYDAK